MFSSRKTLLAMLAASALLAACGGSDDPPPKASLRVAHFAPDVPAVDVFLKTPGAANAAGNRLLQNVTFPTATGYASVDAGSYDASVALAGTLTGVLDLAANLDAGTSTSVFATGLLGGTGAQALALRAYADDRVPVAGKAKVRVIHLSPDAPAVDVVVLGAGGAIAARPVTNLSYPNATASSLQLDPGTYTLAVVPAGASTPVLPTAAGVPVTLAAGDVATVVAIGALAAPGAQPFQFKVLDDR
jgi:hypothetical protein